MAKHRLAGLGGRRADVIVAIAGVIVAVAFVVLGLELAATQSRARLSLTERFSDRARVVSALIQAEIASVATSTAATPTYQSTAVSGRVLDRAVAQGHLAFAMVVSPGGQVIAASRTLTAPDLRQALSSPVFARARAGAPAWLSDVLGGGPGGAGVVDLAVPLHTAAGSRMLIAGLPARALSAFLGPYLQRIGTSTGAAYVVDSRDAVLASSASPPVTALVHTAPVPLHTVDGETGGSYGHGRYFVSAAVPGSTWRVLLTTPESTLFSSVDGSRKWLPWAIYIALGLVAAGFLLLLRRLLGNAAALGTANAQLEDSNRRLQSVNDLLRRAAELSRSNAELEQFASIASHDLQEPLRKVQTFAAQLNATESDHLSDQGQDFLRRMSDAAGRMRALIDDLLVFSRVSTQARPFVDVNLGDVVAQVLLDLEVSIEEAGAQVTVGEMPTIQADPMQMRQLLQNLLGNALKFRLDGVLPEVRVGADVSDHVAELTVSDNGIGFDEQYATRIFRAFERLHGARVYPGTGIGLALCRKIVERHHGTITAHGELDHGATFTIRLPVEQPVDGDAPDGAPLDGIEALEREVGHVPV
jgi:signal transduction histidine kinase